MPKAQEWDETQRRLANDLMQCFCDRETVAACMGMDDPRDLDAACRAAFGADYAACERRNRGKGRAALRMALFDKAAGGDSRALQMLSPCFMDAQRRGEPEPEEM